MYAAAIIHWTAERRVALAALAVLAVIVPLAAQVREPDRRADRVKVGGAPPGPCVAVDIAGHRAGQVECASDRLQRAAQIAQAQAQGPLQTPVAKAGSPDVTVGVSSLSGTRLRMGDALGKSVHPQRPPRR